MRLRPFILCFNRTAISIQKIDSKSSKSHLKSLQRISTKSYRHNFQLKAFFNFAHKRPTFAFTSESGYTLGSLRKIAHNGSRGETGGLPFCEHSVALRCQRNTFYSTVLLYTYISRFSVNPHYQQKRNIRQSCRHKFYPPTAFQLLAQMAHVCFHERKRIDTRLCSKNCTQRFTRRNTGRFGWGRYYYPRSVPHVSETLRGRGLKRQTLPLLGLGRRRS